MTTVEDPGGEDLKVTPPKQWATGVPAVPHAMHYSLEQTSLRRTALTLLNINQANGIDCPGCAWPEPDLPPVLPRRLAGICSSHRLGRLFRRRSRFDDLTPRKVR
jgi:hypothetical protein